MNNRLLPMVMLVCLLLSACGPAATPSPTPEPPKPAAVPPTATSVPPAATAVPPTKAPTATAVPATPTAAAPKPKHADLIQKYEGPKTCAACHPNAAKDVAVSLHYQQQALPQFVKDWQKGQMAGMMVSF